MDVTRYVDLARAAVEDIFARGREVLVVGGSGFYLKVFFAPVADDVEVPDVAAERKANRLERDGLTALVKELRTLNPAGLGALDVSNPRRVLCGTRSLSGVRAHAGGLAGGFCGPAGTIRGF